MKDHLIPSTLPGWPTVTPRSILNEDVEQEVAAYRERQKPTDSVWLDLPSLREAITAGEVHLGSRDLPVPEIDPAFARRAAAEAIIDGIVIMFINEQAISKLDEAHQLTSDSRVRYLRLYAQRGF